MATDLFTQFTDGLRKDKPWETISDFVLSSSFLGYQPYPRQLTLLKLIFLETENMTQFDLDTIEEWRKGFGGTESVGVQPDIWKRVAWLKENGYRRFPHIQTVLGRRAGKGWLGGILGAEHIAFMVSLDNWQKHYGIQAHKSGVLNVIATKESSAIENLFADIKEAVVACKYLQPYRYEIKDHVMKIQTPADIRYVQQLRLRKEKIDRTIASIRATANASSASGGRGQASFANFFDEFAHLIVGTDGPRSSEEVYKAYMPSLRQFKKDGLTYIPSTPLTKVGAFFKLYTTGSIMLPTYKNNNIEFTVHYAADLNKDPEESFSEATADPKMLIIQLPSWGLYENWEDSRKLGLPYDKPEPFVIYDDAMKILEANDRTSFKVEFRGQFAEVEDAYLDPYKVDAIFEPFWGGRILSEAKHGQMAVSYHGHADPGLTGANFAVSIAHLEDAPPDEFGNIWPHAIVDYMHVWNPADFEDHRIDYNVVLDDLKMLLGNYPSMDIFSFDQWNCLAGSTLINTSTGLRTVDSFFDGVKEGETIAIPGSIQSQAGLGSNVLGYKKGVRTTNVFTTKLGNQIECTPEHRIWTKSSTSDWSWKTSAEIDIGDFIAVKKNNLLADEEVKLPSSNWLPPIRRRKTFVAPTMPATVNPDMGRWLGHLASEGWISNKESSYSYSQKDDQVFEDYVTLHVNLFGLIPEVQSRLGSRMARNYCFEVNQLLRSFGMATLSYTKFVPDVIKQSPKPVITEFLRGLFEGDGGVTSNKAGNAVLLWSVSEKMMRDVQQLLLSVGVFSRIRSFPTTQGTKNKYRKTEQDDRIERRWTLTIDGPDIFDYAENVGFISDRKNAILANVLAQNNIKPRSGVRRKNSIHGNEYWVKIEKIEQSSSTVYDLHIPVHENFIANGIVVHNSAGFIASLKQMYGQSMRIKEVNFTAKENFKRAEKFKSAVNLGWIHSYHDNFFNESLGGNASLLEQELKFLTVHNGQIVKQSFGPVTTKDLADTVMESTTRLLEKALERWKSALMGSTTPVFGEHGTVRTIDNASRASGINSLRESGSALSNAQKIASGSRSNRFARSSAPNRGPSRW